MTDSARRLTPIFTRPSDAYSKLEAGLSPEADLTIDCDDCALRQTVACDDCVVTFLVGSPTSHAAPVVIEAGEARALRTLAGVGLVPTLRLVRQAG